METELSPQSCALVSTTFADGGLQPRKQRPYSATPGATVPEKNAFFAPKNIFTCGFARFRPVTRPEVVDMMMWLQWWDMNMMTRPPLHIGPWLGSFRTSYLLFYVLWKVAPVFHQPTSGKRNSMARLFLGAVWAAKVSARIRTWCRCKNI